MSLVFSDPTKANGGGIVELIDDSLKTTSTSYPLAQKVRDVNLALDRALAIIFQAQGTWQFDDSNQTDLPIISTNLVAGQRDYSFLADGSGNLILDFFKVLVADVNGLFTEITLRDASGEDEGSLPDDSGTGVVTTGDISGFTSGVNATGTPNQYDKIGNSIFLDPIPSYNYASGLKAYVSRESTYFTVSDTTKKPGIAGIFHEYLALHAALKYATRNGMSVAGGTMRGGYKTGLLADVYEMEQQITTYYGSRERAGRKRMTAAPINYR